MRVSVVNKALLAPRLNNGVTNKALGLCWGPGAFVGFLLATSVNVWYAAIPIGISAATHAALSWAFKKDPRIFSMYAQYALMAKRYHPDCRETLPAPFERPHKVGRGLRM
jgi:type IV secretory pathway TrbD component